MISRTHFTLDIGCEILCFLDPGISRSYPTSFLSFPEEVPNLWIKQEPKVNPEGFNTCDSIYIESLHSKILEMGSRLVVTKSYSLVQEMGNIKGQN